MGGGEGERRGASLALRARLDAPNDSFRYVLAATIETPRPTETERILLALRGRERGQSARAERGVRAGGGGGAAETHTRGAQSNAAKRRRSARREWCTRKQAPSAAHAQAEAGASGRKAASLLAPPLTRVPDLHEIRQDEARKKRGTRTPQTTSAHTKMVTEKHRLGSQHSLFGEQKQKEMCAGQSATWRTTGGCRLEVLGTAG